MKDVRFKAVLILVTLQCLVLQVYSQQGNCIVRDPASHALRQESVLNLQSMDNCAKISGSDKQFISHGVRDGFVPTKAKCTAVLESFSSIEKSSKKLGRRACLAYCFNHDNLTSCHWKGDTLYSYHDELLPLKFRWSYRGPISGMECIKIYEPSDPNDWHDNFLCTNRPVGLRWSHRGPIDGLKCTHIHEKADPHDWHDNYLCLPNNSKIKLDWKSARKLANQKNCVQLDEPSDPHTWDDNSLCYKDAGKKRVKGLCVEYDPVNLNARSMITSRDECSGICPTGHSCTFDGEELTNLNENQRCFIVGEAGYKRFSKYLDSKSECQAECDSRSSAKSRMCFYGAQRIHKQNRVDVVNRKCVIEKTGQIVDTKLKTPNHECSEWCKSLGDPKIKCTLHTGLWQTVVYGDPDINICSATDKFNRFILRDRTNNENECQKLCDSNSETNTCFFQGREL